MGLFTKKEPCAICGGKVKGLLPLRIEGQLICNACYGFIDLPDHIRDNLTLDSFREYMAFRDENAKFRDVFQQSQNFVLGFFTGRIVLDKTNGLFCLSDTLNATIFEAKHIKSFSITEDGSPLFEGSAAGLICHKSMVFDHIDSLTRQINMIRLERARQQVRNNADNTDYCNPLTNVTEPFKKFLIEIQLKDHPYWSVINLKHDGPFFNSNPDLGDYLRDYNEAAAKMKEIATALLELAFPGASVITEGEAMLAAATRGAAAPASSADVVEEIQRYKSLMDQGIITEEEFAAKKRQLLGI